MSTPDRLPEEPDEITDDFETPEEPDEITDHFETTEELDESDRLPDDRQELSETEQPLNNNYDFAHTTIIVGIQILPTNSEREQRLVLLSAGIKGSQPLLASTTLAEIERVETLADILEKLKQSLPQIAVAAKLRAEKLHGKRQRPATRPVIPTPELPQNHLATTSSSQLSLF